MGLLPHALPRRKARSSRSLPRSHWCCIALRRDGGGHKSFSTQQLVLFELVRTG